MQSNGIIKTPTMDQVRINEMNASIAEFMGARKEGHWIEIPHRVYALSVRYYPGTLKYHCDWGWLMPVIEGIYKLQGNAFWEYQQEARKRYKLISNELLKVDIVNTHHFVYSFIEWYNKIKF